jgi:hypothetical protein
MKIARTYLALLTTIIVTAAGLSAVEITVTPGFQAKNDDPGAKSGVFPTLDFKLEHAEGGWDFFGELYTSTDGKFSSPQPDYYHSIYFLMPEAGVGYKSGYVGFKAGRFAQTDIVDSPYSLFFSSNRNSALSGDFTYDNGFFFYETRWVQLTLNSNYLWPDRGMNFKNYGVRLGKFRIAYEDASVYTGRSFDVEDFLSPIPSYFLQYIRSSSNPWKEGTSSVSADQNAIIGFLCDYTDDSLYAYGQILIDDFSLNSIIKPKALLNPDKIAFSTGGRTKTEYGTFGLYGALATQYTFEPGTNVSYGYTYYPATQYAGGDATIWPTDSNIGFIHGENSVALKTDYSNVFEAIPYTLGLELAFTGTQSPANPWGKDSSWRDFGGGTHLLDNGAIQKTLTLTCATSYGKDNWKLGVKAAIGYVWDSLALVEVAPYAEDPYNAQNNAYFAATGSSGIRGSLGVTFSYAFGSNEAK